MSIQFVTNTKFKHDMKGKDTQVVKIISKCFEKIEPENERLVG